VECIVDAMHVGMRLKSGNVQVGVCPEVACLWSVLQVQPVEALARMGCRRA
jgi:hypothetical protein